MDWQMPPLEVCLGLLFISIGLVVGFDIRFKIKVDNDRSKG